MALLPFSSSLIYLDVKRVTQLSTLIWIFFLRLFFLLCIPLREIYPWISASARYPAWFCYVVRCLLSSGKFLLFWTELYEGCLNSALGCLGMGWDGWVWIGLCLY